MLVFPVCAQIIIGRKFGCSIIVEGNVLSETYDLRIEQNIINRNL